MPNELRAPSASASALREHAADERGAVMVLGLFLALAAIAALWCMIGIGDAVIARDRSQEAADSVAYASAVLHARGMNFIALINIVTLAMAMLYVLLSLIDLLLSLVLALTGIREVSLNWCVWRYVSWLGDADVPWCQVARVVENIEVAIYKFDRLFFNKYKKIAPPLFKTQSFAASAVPFLAFAAGAEAGVEYGHVGLAYSHSLWPGGGAPQKLNFLRPLLNKVPFLVQKIKGDNSNLFQDRRIGLPVDAEPAYNLCIRGTRFGLEWVKNLPGQKSFGGLTWREWSATEPTSFAFYWLFQLTGETTRLFFCRDKDPMDYWKPSVNSAGINVAALTLRGVLLVGLAGLPSKANDKFYLGDDGFWRISDDSLGAHRDSNKNYWVGPKRVVAYAYNGNDWMQVWATVRAFEQPERAAKNVAMPSRIFELEPKSKQKGLLATAASGWFFSGAEFYFDCGTVWQSSECNKGSAALYQMNWRARLRRVHWPNPVNMAFEMFMDNFLMGSAFKSLGKLAFGWMPQTVQESLIKSLRNETQKMLNHRVHTDDTSVGDYYH